MYVVRCGAPEGNKCTPSAGLGLSVFSSRLLGSGGGTNRGLGGASRMTLVVPGRAGGCTGLVGTSLSVGGGLGGAAGGGGVPGRSSWRNVKAGFGSSGNGGGGATGSTASGSMTGAGAGVGSGAIVGAGGSSTGRGTGGILASTGVGNGAGVDNLTTRGLRGSGVTAGGDNVEGGGWGTVGAVAIVGAITVGGASGVSGEVGAEVGALTKRAVRGELTGSFLG